MKAYYYDGVPGDPRLPHESSPSSPSSSPSSSSSSSSSSTSPHLIDPTHLATLGLLHRSFPPSLPSSPAAVNALAAERRYSHRDEITVSPEAMSGPGVYEGKIAMFFAEHMHEDEEIRYVLKGAGYFDVREKGDERWVRVRLEEGDLLVLPAGIYHRFTVDEGNYIKAMRLFKDEPKWTPLNRGAETEANPYRKAYVHAREEGEFEREE